MSRKQNFYQNNNKKLKKWHKNRAKARLLYSLSSVQLPLTSATQTGPTRVLVASLSDKQSKSEISLPLLGLKINATSEKWINPESGPVEGLLLDNFHKATLKIKSCLVEFHSGPLYTHLQSIKHFSSESEIERERGWSEIGRSSCALPGGHFCQSGWIE